MCSHNFNPHINYFNRLTDNLDLNEIHFDLMMPNVLYFFMYE